MVLNMALAYGEAPKVIHTLGSGEKEELMVMEFILGSMATATKVNSRTVLNMEKESSILPMETPTKVTIRWESHRDMANTTGSAAVFLKGSSRQASGADKACGRKEQAEAISMKESG